MSEPHIIGAIGPVTRLREPVSLKRIFPTASFVGCADIRVTDVTEVAANAKPGDLFVAKRGARHQGSAFAEDAVRRGASALLASHPIAGLSVPQCIIPDVSRGFGVLCSTLSGRPMRTVRTVGVTGTNGKTTVSWLLRTILQHAGQRCGLLGTIEYWDGVRTSKATLTTPDTKTFWDWFSAMNRNRCQFAAIEISSHALEQERVAGAELEAAIVTNVTQDHLDYHETLSNYLASKAKIVSLVRPGGVVILNQDDPAVDVLRSRVPEGVDVMTFALSRRAAVVAESIEQTSGGLRFALSLRGRRHDVETRLFGRHNVANCLAAAAAAEHLGLSAEQIVEGLNVASAPPGRMERIGGGSDLDVFIDYAHTPDALEKAIAATRQMCHGKLLVVFGAGGDRDRTKRPLLGRAATMADVAIVTSDNPRSEDPEQIIEDVVGEMSSERCETYIEPDRAAAIRLAVMVAEPGDSVLIAGKGHETTQCFSDRVEEFSDQKVAAETVRQRMMSRRPRWIAA